MPDTLSILTGIALLAVGTYVMRASGALLSGRFSVSSHVKNLLSMGAIVILFAVAVTMTIFSGQELSDWPKIAGVAVAGLLTWYKKPFLLIVLAAAVVTALLRYLLSLW
ncbi:AzlD domain-containing protein [Morganella psychrotolerans]|uniref:AzlD domain-containing protein n=1 Tax=Morganella psychrotolerans TaxID=368603 RepID=A0A5M9RA11_9GAMM|nr:AzlD domain-containing protein [Morganella psychrotolerans]KAA8717383.1 AzlD domain-containing protein [Morganella psychrotolerans]OBU08339.1 branched-chain amino acid transport [Morganella psychrotolerans]